MIYSHKVRMESVPVFGAFDCPDAGQAKPQRSQSTTAIQALNLFNSPFVNQQAGALAKHVAEEGEVRGQIERLFQCTFGRQPSSVESAAAVKVVEQHGLNVVCRVLLNSNEFLFIP